MTVPKQITCEQCKDTNDIPTTANSISSIKQPRQEPRLLTPEKIQASSTATSYAAATNGSIFRPLTKERTVWCPPLYRDTSLLSSPSKEFYNASLSSSSSSSRVDHYQRHHYEEPKNLPKDFVPPRHTFSSLSSGAISSPSHSAVKLRSDDIVCGRGAPVQFHPGNHAYRELIKQYETSYLCAKRNDKPEIAMKVLEVLKERKVRFVKREKEDCGMIWVEISEKRAYEKVCQSLRDGAPELRRRMMKVKRAEEEAAAQVAERDRTNRVLFEDQSLFFREEQNLSPIPLLPV